VGVFLLSVSLVGYWKHKLPNALRGLALLGGITAFWLGATNVAALVVCWVVLGGLYGLQRIQARTAPVT
jgi:hypothetical protein